MAKQDRDSNLDRHRITDGNKLAAMSSSFNEGKHIELEGFPAERALLYKLQILNDEIKELHRFLGAEVTSNIATNLTATANGTSLSVNSSDGDNVSLPAATTNAWGVMTDEMFDAVAANTNKNTNVTTNLSTTANGTSLTVNSSDGNNASIPAATTSAWGAMTDEMFDKLDGVAASSNNYVHPNHSGEVTSTRDGATVIADNIVDEANLKVSNTPTDGYVLTAQSGNTGGLTWAEASSGGGGEPGGSVYDNTIKLLLTDFRSNDDANLERVMLEDDTSNNLSIRIGSTSIEMYATIPLPKGKKVTHMHIYASATLTCNSYEVNLTTGARTSKATGNSNTTIPFNDGRTNREFNSTATNYLAIRVNTTSTSQKLYGGIITIADI